MPAGEERTRRRSCGDRELRGGGGGGGGGGGHGQRTPSQKRLIMEVLPTPPFPTTRTFSVRCTHITPSVSDASARVPCRRG